ncbi:MAG: NAD(P)/FAD-dependent oxidoreductase, partial [Candidatus Lokiarchaeota archaeon]|nr:NAD(P)/FAD-dependent oxidoreductase [Candidatus Lokiarchaeota archaeon]
MKVVVVGNNVAGTFSAQNIRFLNEEVEIEIFTQERYPYYTRVNLPELISDKVQVDDLIVFKDDWYKDKNIKLNLNSKVTKIEPDQKFI